MDISIDRGEVALPPLLFISLLENAFKYNIDQKDCILKIVLQVKGNEVYFMVQNKYDKNEKNKSHGGLGLQNLEKRLKLYFQNSYTYQVSKEDSIYTAQLNLDLK